MSRTLLFAGMLLVTQGCGGEDPAEPVVPEPDSATVSMPGFSFVPFTTTVRVGGTVVFDFPAEPHNVIFARVTGAPPDIPISSGRTVARAFPVAGTFDYDCTLHPGMSGSVIVR